MFVNDYIRGMEFFYFFFPAPSFRAQKKHLPDREGANTPPKDKLILQSLWRWWSISGAIYFLATSATAASAAAATNRTAGATAAGTTDTAAAAGSGRTSYAAGAR